ncbi:MAG: superoxide dismutase family protein [Thiohalocapsa sp.]|uniref:superoxide dismutase family protein n=1 Tax=Thiohalocapsa sp. TaxID=2497641 RepID=UPI0026006664|nr:superoxide dismutase family protein [Thiohalocapsa sp.]MCG6941872.1 superoxide dismutase family protein [Thiohalocapsa sp.]
MHTTQPIVTPRIPQLCSAAAIALAAVLVAPTAGADTDKATADIKDLKGEVVGTAELQQTPAGVLLDVKLNDLPAGVHALHIHETGKCEPPFKSAGGHYHRPGETHGYLTESGPHAGDMPNIHVPESGQLELEVLTGVHQLGEEVLDVDGSSLVIHEGADDYKSQPAGAAGERIACGVITAQ